MLAEALVDRLDIVLDYPTTTTYYQAMDAEGKAGSKFIAKRMVENKDFYPYFVACNKATGADAIITKVNDIILTNNSTPSSAAFENKR